MTRAPSSSAGSTSARRRLHPSGGPKRTVAALAAAALLLAGCSTKAQPSSETGTGPGVTKDTITLGVLNDLSGPFAALGKSIAIGHQIYLDEVNKAGGICGRKVVLDIKDHGYDVQKAVGLYSSMSPRVLGMLMLVGSGVNAALKENVKSDNMFTVQGSFASFVLDTPQYVVMGGTFDVDMVNGVSWLVKEQGLKAGDKIGYLYAEGEQGENNLLGVSFATEKRGIKG